MNRLQVMRSGGWEYVFCRGPRGIVTTPDRRNALGKDALDFFKSNFANDVFRIELKVTVSKVKENG